MMKFMHKSEFFMIVDNPSDIKKKLYIYKKK